MKRITKMRENDETAGSDGNDESGKVLIQTLLIAAPVALIALVVYLRRS